MKSASTPQLTQLETRQLFSGSPAPAAAESAESSPLPETDVPAQIAQQVPVAQSEPAPENQPEPAAQEAAAPTAPDQTTANLLDSQSIAAQADSPESTAEVHESLSDAGEQVSQHVVESIADVAAERWAQSGHLSETQIEELGSIDYAIENLSGNALGITNGASVKIDSDAAGEGWFIDQTPFQDEEFQEGRSANAGYDLLTVLLHEQGHVLGLADTFSDSSDLMYGFLAEGERRLPTAGQSDGATIGSIQSDAFMGGTSANIEVEEIFFVDGNGDPIDNPVTGVEIRPKVRFRVTDLPADADYEISYVVNGVEYIRDNLTTGAGGDNGLRSWIKNSGFTPTDPVTLTVTVDAKNEVAETSELDNSLTINVNPISATEAGLPSKFIMPLAGEVYKDWGFGNYVDIDQRPGIQLDPFGGEINYDGHTGIDLGFRNFGLMDQGLNIVAAADGIVSEVIDENFDRQTGSLDRPPTNKIVIDHGNGWQTYYHHLRRDSAMVEVGDTVKQGEVIAIMGSSGSSTHPHIDFQIQLHGSSGQTEGFIDPNTYYVDPPAYPVGQRALIVSGVSNYRFEDQREGPNHIEKIDRNLTALRTYSIFNGLAKDDVVNIIWKRPNGSEFARKTVTATRDHSWRNVDDIRNISNGALGEWTVEYRVNDELKGSETFEITNDGAPRLRVQEGTDSDDNGPLVRHERYTPYDLGTIAQNGAAPQMTFIAINHGSATLDIAGIELPQGFSLVEGLPASLDAGSSNAFTVALDTSEPGNFAGQVRIASNDTINLDYVFSVEGLVTDGANENLKIGVSERGLSDGEGIIAKIRRTGDTTDSLTVLLQSDDTTIATVPLSVTIPAGASFANFTIQTLGNATADQTIRLSASAAGFTNAYNEIEVDAIPAPVISTTADTPNNLANVPFQANFGETVAGFAISDISLAGVGGTVTNFMDLGGGLFSFDVEPQEDGAIHVDIGAGVATDGNRNQTLAATRVSFTSDRTEPEFDRIPIIAPVPSDAENGVIVIPADSVNTPDATVTFSIAPDSNPENAFKINAQTGEVSVNDTAALNGDYNLKLVASDAAGNVGQVDVPITIEEAKDGGGNTTGGNATTPTENPEPTPPSITVTVPASVTPGGQGFATTTTPGNDTGGSQAIVPDGLVPPVVADAILNLNRFFIEAFTQSRSNLSVGIGIEITSIQFGSERAILFQFTNPELSTIQGSLRIELDQNPLVRFHTADESLSIEQLFQQYLAPEIGTEAAA